jgi:glycosyltransferase
LAVRLSVVTPCRDAAAFVAEAVDSLAAQLPAGAEHIVVDGASGDGTLEILARYSHLTVVSRPDQSLYQALNDGVAMAGGEVIGFLNADDQYAPGVIAEALEEFDEDDEVDVVCGGSAVFADGRLAQWRRHVRDGGLWLPELMFGAAALNARFYRRRLVERVGGFDPRFGLAADRHWLLRLFCQRPHRVGFEHPVMHYRQHVGSATLAPGAASARPIVEAHVAIAEDLLRAPGLSPAERAQVRAWRAWERWRLATASARLPLALGNPLALPMALALKAQVRRETEIATG